MLISLEFGLMTLWMISHNKRLETMGGLERRLKWAAGGSGTLLGEEIQARVGTQWIPSTPSFITLGMWLP